MAAAATAGADAGPGVAVPLDLRRERRMVCVEYPGVVRDVSKMLQTLGGEEGVSRVRSRTGGSGRDRGRDRVSGPRPEGRDYLGAGGSVVSLATELGAGAGAAGGRGLASCAGEDRFCLGAVGKGCSGDPERGGVSFPSPDPGSRGPLIVLCCHFLIHRGKDPGVGG